MRLTLESVDAPQDHLIQLSFNTFTQALLFEPLSILP
jgi:hypothetical protein